MNPVRGGTPPSNETGHMLQGPNRRTSNGVKRAIAVCSLSAPVLAAAICSIACSLGFLGRPFPGFLSYPNLLVSPFYLSGWIAPQEGAVYPWALESVDSAGIHTAKELERTLSSMSPGEIHVFTFKKGDDRMTKGLPMTIFHLSDYLGACGLMALSGLTMIAIGIVVLLSVPASPSSWAVWALAAALGAGLVQGRTG